MTAPELLSAVCPVCNRNVDGMYSDTSKWRIVYACTNCGATTDRWRDMQMGNISRFTTEDCDNCKYSDENTIENYCPYGKSGDCLMSACCHYPCSCTMILGTEAFDKVSFCRRKPAPFEKTVTQLLVAILRELRNK